MTLRPSRYEPREPNMNQDMNQDMKTTQTIDDLLSQLNDEQRQAVEINDGALLVFAGAGSGKTRVITTKIAYAIERLNVEPWRILAVTFTNKACKEMKDRVGSFVGEEKASQVMIKTFHSFGVWLLRKYGTRVGLDPNFKIYDDDDSVTLLSQYYPDVEKRILREVSKKISLLKDQMKTPSYSDPSTSRYAEYFFKYEEALAQTGNVDFADMIIKSIKLLSENPDVREYVHNRFRMILVDEYQDSNTAQFLLLKQIVGPNTFICAVGDDDQSIYSFRGAEVKNILDFSTAFPNTKKVLLGTNYRCTQSILAAASDVISKNMNREQKKLVSGSVDNNIKPKIIYVDSDKDEALKVVELLKEAGKYDKSAYSKSAILYRTNSQTKTFEDCFLVNRIPYHVVGSLKFYDREEVRDCIALISLIANPRDSVAFQRMVNKPARKVGDASIEKILSYAQNNPMMGGDIIYAARNTIVDGIVKGVASTGLSLFLQAYDKCKAQFGVLPNDKLLENAIEDFGLRDYYVQRDKDEQNLDYQRTESLDKIIDWLSTVEFSDGLGGLNAFLEFVSLDPSSVGKDASKKDDGVTLITMHNTKGLEYDRVFMVGMEDEIFPGQLDSENERKEMEEERRICYVAMTRAKKELFLSSASSRFRFGHWNRETPSRFLTEIALSHIEVQDCRTTKEKFKTSNYGFRYDYWKDNSFGSDFDDFDDYGERSGRSSYGSGSGYGGGFRQYGYGNYGSWKKKDQAEKPSGPKPSEAGKYNIRNKNGALAKSGVVLVKKASKTSVLPGSVKFEVGDRIRSQFYGEGTITGKRQFGGREVLDVKFDTGRTGTFATATAAFEKI